MKKRFDCMAKKWLHAKFREKSTQRPPNFINVLNGLKSNEADKMAQ